MWTTGAWCLEGKELTGWLDEMRRTETASYFRFINHLEWDFPKSQNCQLSRTFSRLFLTNLIFGLFHLDQRTVFGFTGLFCQMMTLRVTVLQNVVNVKMWSAGASLHPKKLSLRLWTFTRRTCRTVGYSSR